MAAVIDILRADLSHQGVVFKPPHGKVRLVPADPSNYDVARQGQPRKHLCLFWHSTQGFNSEDWFANPAANASTPWIVKDDEVVHCVPEEYVSYAQGTFSNPRDRRFNDRLVRDGGRPPWMPSGYSYNCLGEGIEVEGFSDDVPAVVNGKTYLQLSRTFTPGGPQWDNAASLAGFLMWKHEDEMEESIERWLRHQDVSFKKSDPGTWFKSQMPALYGDAIAFKRDWAEQASRVSKAETGHPVETHDDRVAESESRLAKHDAELDAVADRVQVLERQIQAIHAATARG